MTEKKEKKPEFKNIAEVLHFVQMNLHAPKNQLNKFGGYKYRSCEDILEGLKKVLPEGAYVTVQDDMVMIGNRYYVKAIASLCFGENCLTNTAFAREEESKKGMDASQITGSASSYARKYALNGLFLIDDTKDADAQEPEDKKTGKETKIELPDEEMKQFENDLKDVKTVEELLNVKDKARAAWKRMSKSQQDIVTKMIETTDKRIT